MNYKNTIFMENPQEHLIGPTLRRHHLWGIYKHPSFLNFSELQEYIAPLISQN